MARSAAQAEARKTIAMGAQGSDMATVINLDQVKTDANSSVVVFDGITLDTADRKQVDTFIGQAVNLYRQGKRAIHLAASVALYHAQQHGDAHFMNKLFRSFDPDKEKQLLAGLRAWAGKNATHITPATETEGEIERVWIVFKNDEFSVKNKSEAYRKDNLSLQQIIDGKPFYQKLEQEGNRRGPDFIAFLKQLEKFSDQREEKAAELGFALPHKLTSTMEAMSGQAKQLREMIEYAGQNLTFDDMKKLGIAPPADDKQEGEDKPAGEQAA